MTAPDRRPGLRQRALPGPEHERLWSRTPDRTGDPLTSPDGCTSCAGTGTDLRTDPPGSCSSCSDTGWKD